MKRNKAFGRAGSRVRTKGRGYEQRHLNCKNKPWKSEDGDFRCCCCRQMVYMTDSMGTVHRNHCPNCLWSLHVDTKPGNRASTCHAQMEPVALTFKRGGIDKYGRERSGDVMIVHLCKGCGSININRIAADDSSHMIFEVFQNSLALDHGLRETVHNGGVNILQIEDTNRLQNAIYGKLL